MSTGEVQGDGADTARVQAEFTALTKASPPNLKPAHRRLVNAENPTPAALGAQFRARAAVHTAAVHTAVDAALDAALDTAVQPAVQPAPASASAGAAPPARWLGAMGDLAAPGSAGTAAQRGAAVLVSAHASATAPTRLVSDMTALQGLLQSAVADSHRRHGLAATAAPAAPAVPAASAPSLPAATGLRAWPAIDPLTEDMLVDRLADLLQDRLREQALRHLGFTGGLA